jgi:hypothetical protein
MNGSQSYASGVSKEQWALQKNVGKRQAPSEGRPWLGARAPTKSEHYQQTGAVTAWDTRS